MNHTIATTLILAGLALTVGCQKPRDWTQPEEATAEYEARQLEKSTSLVRDAQRFEAAGRPEDALMKYELAISTYRENSIAWHNAGILYSKQGKNMQAATCFKTASELAPSDPRPLYELGVLWDDLGYLEDASRWYDEALQRDSSHQNSLRRSILADELRHKLTPTTADRLKTAMLAEREPWWINRFRRIHQLMADIQPNSSSAPDDLSRPPTIFESMRPSEMLGRPASPASPAPVEPATPVPATPALPKS